MATPCLGVIATPGRRYNHPPLYIKMIDVLVLEP